MRRSLDRLWEDQSIEACEDWVIPYIAALLDTNLVPAMDAARPAARRRQHDQLPPPQGHARPGRAARRRRHRVGVPRGRVLPRARAAAPWARPGDRPPADSRRSRRRAPAAAGGGPGRAADRDAARGVRRPAQRRRRGRDGLRVRRVPPPPRRAPRPRARSAGTGSRSSACSCGSYRCHRRRPRARPVQVSGCHGALRVRPDGTPDRAVAADDRPADGLRRDAGGRSPSGRCPDRSLSCSTTRCSLADASRAGPAAGRTRARACGRRRCRSARSAAACRSTRTTVDGVARGRTLQAAPGGRRDGGRGRLPLRPAGRDRRRAVRPPAGVRDDAGRPAPVGSRSPAAPTIALRDALAAIAGSGTVIVTDGLTSTDVADVGTAQPIGQVTVRAADERPRGDRPPSSRAAPWMFIGDPPGAGERHRASPARGRAAVSGQDIVLRGGFAEVDAVVLHARPGHERRPA